MYRTSGMQRVGFLALAVWTAGTLFAAPEQCARALREGLTLCGGPLLLSLFPFLIVSPLVVQSGAGQLLGILLRPVARLIGVKSPEAGGVLLIGLLGGFAPAASAVAEAVRTGRLSTEEAAALLPACICAAPSFVILTVGGQMLHSRALGVQLFVAQVSAGYLTAALLNRLHRNARKSTPAPPAAVRETEPPRLDRIIASAAGTYVALCGFVLYFRMLSACGVPLPDDGWKTIPAMFLEVCTGCDYAARTGLPASGLCCAALSLQSASVLMQVRTICPQQISFRRLLAGRLVHLPLSLAVFYLSLQDRAVQTFSTLCSRVIPMRRVPVDCALMVFLVSCAVACELCRVLNGSSGTARQRTAKTSVEKT